MSSEIPVLVSTIIKLQCIKQFCIFKFLELVIKSNDFVITSGQDYNIGAAGSGRMDLSTIIVGPNLKGCVSLLEFPGVDLLPADDCGFPVSLISGDITYFEGTCSNIPESSVTCPTTRPPPYTGPTPEKIGSVT